MTATVSVDVLARDRASTTFDRVGRSAEHSGGMLHKFGGIAAGLLTGGALAIGGGELVSVFKELAEGAVKDEEGAKRLALQLHNSAGATDEQVAATERWISAQESALGVSDDDLRPALARAVTATHSVAEAQQQVSLAMDVAAGRGKSLQSVEEALAKARQGNVSGLSRLGVATKDAAGETLTYDQITQQLAQTFKGQAADAAETTAGKYQRLKVEFSEMGETIGYKLLPTATRFGQWMLDEGVPAASKFGTYVGHELTPALRELQGWWRSNHDELQRLGQEILSTAIPAAEQLGHAAGVLLGWFDNLPGPVKQFGVEVGIAAYVLPKLSSALGGVNLTAFAANLRTAETRTVALQEAARSAAGAGGVGALIAGTRESNHGLSELELTAGGAALGFSVGGPLGAAIGGTAGALVGLAKNYRSTAGDAHQAYLKIAAIDPVKDADRAFSNLKGTLDEVSGAYTSATRAAVLHDLQGNKGLIQSANAAGISTRTLVDATLGQGTAMQQVGVLMGSYKNHIAELGTELDSAKKAADIAHYRITGYTKEADEAAAAHVNSLASEKKAQEEQLAMLQRGLPAYAAEQAQVQKNAAAVADYSGKLHGLPKELQTEIRQDGINTASTSMAALVRQYDLTPKQIKTLVEATGTDTVGTDMKNLQAALRQYDYTHATANVSVDPGSSFYTITSLRNQIASLHDRTIHVTTVNGHSTVEPHAHVGDSRTSSNVLPPSANGRMLAGTADAKRQADAIGKVLDSKNADLTRAGQHLLESVVKGIGKGAKSLDTITDRVQSRLQKKVDAYQAILADYQSIGGGFSGFQKSVFAVEGSTDDTGNQLPATLAQIMGQSASNAGSSGQLNADVTKLIGEGLNKQLLLQMQAAGEAGEQNIHTLAMQASLQDIATLNAQQAQTDANLSAAGTAIAQKLDGAQLAAAKTAQDQLQRLDDIVSALHDFDGKFEFVLRGDQLEAVRVKHQKQQGKKK